MEPKDIYKENCVARLNMFKISELHGTFKWLAYAADTGDITLDQIKQLTSEIEYLFACSRINIKIKIWGNDGLPHIYTKSETMDILGWYEKDFMDKKYGFILQEYGKLCFLIGG